MTTALTEDLQEALADKARREKMIVGSNHTNVFVVIDFAGSLIIGVYGPFRSRNAGKLSFDDFEQNRVAIELFYRR